MRRISLFVTTRVNSFVKKISSSQVGPLAVRRKRVIRLLIGPTTAKKTERHQTAKLVDDTCTTHKQRRRSLPAGATRCCRLLVRDDEQSLRMMLTPAGWLMVVRVPSHCGRRSWLRLVGGGDVQPFRQTHLPAGWLMMVVVVLNHCGKRSWLEAGWCKVCCLELAGDAHCCRVFFGGGCGGSHVHLTRKTLMAGGWMVVMVVMVPSYCGRRSWLQACGWC